MRTVKVIKPHELSSETGQTPFLVRYEAVSERLTSSENLWMGLSILEPGLKTGVHHHGASETALYVVRGVGRWWIGSKLNEPVEAQPGDFLYIPPNVLHWEENVSTTDPVEMIVARSTMEAIVVNVDDHPYAPDFA